MTVPILGLDLSLTATGVFGNDAAGEAHYGVLRTKTALGDARLEFIDEQVTHYLDAIQPSFAVIEDLPYSARNAGVTGMVQGVVRLRLQQRRIPYLLTVASTLKVFATGDGRAKKPDMIAMWNARHATQLKDDNIVDAGWLWSMGRWLVDRDDAWGSHRASEAGSKLLPQYFAYFPEGVPEDG